jgi:dipeptidyl aminopeptidase/acylaminoacyl peptidase
MQRLLLTVVVCLTLAWPAIAQSRMDLDAFGRIVRVADPQIAPDGKSIVVVVSRANYEENRYAAKIRTPTLIMTNMGDYRVPPTQAFKLYHAIRDNGVESKFIGYPLPGHNAADPVHQRDVQRRWMERIADHFGPARTTTSGQ